MARQNCCFSLFVFFALFMTIALAVDYRPFLPIEVTVKVKERTTSTLLPIEVKVKVKERTTSNHLEEYFENIEAENLYNTGTICFVLGLCFIIFTSIIVCVTLWPDYFRSILSQKNENSNGGSEV